MDFYISFKKAATYLEDREGVRRVENLYCYKRCFASVLVPDSADEEVYLSGFCRIDEDYANEFHGIVDDTDDIESDPIVQVISGKINGKPIIEDDCRLFVLKDRIYKDDVYVKQSEIEGVAEYFGIPKSKSFQNKYLKTINVLEQEYDPTVNLIFYPEEEEEFNEFSDFYDLSKPSTEEEKVHGNTINNAVLREQVLGAALALMICDKGIGRNKSGKVMASKLREAVEQYAARFWKAGAPPLAVTTIEDVFRSWIKCVPETPEQLQNKPTNIVPF